MKEEEENDSQIEEISYKIILLGDTSAGKTCFFKRLTMGNFNDKIISTIGVDKKSFKIKCDFDENGEKVEKNVVIILTDTAGQERYQSLTQNYYRGSDSAILFYDITNKKSFNNIKIWKESIIKENGKESDDQFIIFLIGTKLDLVEDGQKERKVTIEEAKDKCKELGLYWSGEISSKEFDQDKMLDIIKENIRILYSKIGIKKEENESFVLKKQNKKNKNKKKKNPCPC